MPFSVESGRQPLAITAGNETLHAADSFLLRRPAEPVFRREFDRADVGMIIQDLLHVAGATTNLEEDKSKRTMVGLHARQLGYDKNILVFWSNYKAKKDRPEGYQPKFRVIMNPQITRRSWLKNKGPESCFSIEGVGSTAVPRHNSVTFKGLEVNLDELQQTGQVVVTAVKEKIRKRNIARFFQHEADHGEGRRFAAIARKLNRKGKPKERIPADEEASVRAMSQPWPHKEPREYVIMKNLKAA